MRRIGVFGGSFDPVHLGHVAMAKAFRDAFQLECVYLMPTANPPHRPNTLSPARHRVAMLELAFSAETGFQIDQREIHRDGTAYTIDTLEEIQNEQGPETLIHWLIGADSFLNIGTWRRWRDLLDIGVLAVVCRPGFDLDGWQQQMPEPVVREVLPKIQSLTLPKTDLRGTISFLPTKPLAISATAIRQCLAGGNPVEGLVSDAVRDYAGRHLLYRS
ncbi:nicotinate-nucleotide adenylyltransferase [Burkholderiaceae bacterium DAT-1]|nr:nicotinate-nucleotide adenylyltransferase [Burkholderiaceae bacterium DAT-1]